MVNMRLVKGLTIGLGALGIGQCTYWLSLPTSHPPLSPPSLPPYVLRSQQMNNPKGHPVHFTRYVVTTSSPSPPTAMDLTRAVFDSVPMLPQRIVTNIATSFSAKKEGEREEKEENFLTYKVDYKEDDCVSVTSEWCGGFSETHFLRRVIKHPPPLSPSHNNKNNDDDGKEDKRKEVEVEWWFETVMWSPKKDELPLTGIYSPMNFVGDLYSRIILGAAVKTLEKEIQKKQ